MKSAPPNVTVVGRVSDANLRWLYSSSVGLVAASFGKPTAALRWGGFLDTTVEGTTGVLFDEPRPPLIAGAVDRLSRTEWDPTTLTDHAAQFSTPRFIDQMTEVIAEERRLL
jgi:hypothetical protein